MTKIYHYPKLSQMDAGLFRSPGPGLGNLLFPIARALIGQAERGGEFVYPTMRQLKIGTYLRNEADKRTYGDVIRPRRGDEWLTWFGARLAPKISEMAVSSRASECVCYEGMQGYFLPLHGHSQRIYDWLSRNGHLVGAVADSYDIAVHVRYADFIEDDGDDGFNIRQPWEWYRAAITEAKRLSAKADPTIYLFTDMDMAEALQGLDIGPMDIDGSRNALTAMMNIAKADIVVTSRSTFSMWGVFLGNNTAIWNEKMAVSRYFTLRPELDHFI